MSNFQTIRTLSEKKKITLREIANRIGISEGALQKIIKNGSTNTKTLESISAVLEVNPGVFFGDTPAVNQQGKNNIHAIGSNQISINCENELKEAKKEIDYLKNILMEKERTIEILIKKNTL